MFTFQPHKNMRPVSILEAGTTQAVLFNYKESTPKSPELSEQSNVSCMTAL